MAATTPEQFWVELQLEREAKGVDVCDDVGAPFLGIPRKLAEFEYLLQSECDCLRLRRAGKTLREIGALVALSPERVRQILMKTARIAEQVERKWRLYGAQEEP